jgi:TonB family protein
MPNPYAVDQLDQCIQTRLSHAESPATASDPELRELLAVVEQLESLPDPEFKRRLKADLLEAAVSVNKLAADTHPVLQVVGTEIPPVLFAAKGGTYPVYRGSFVASALAHAAALALVVTVGIFAAHRDDDTPRVSSVVVTDLSPYLLPPSPDRTGGGGGGGDHDKTQASHGNPPPFAERQITPPAIVVRNEDPKLAVAPTVIGPPALSFPQTQIGDPLSSVLGPASNGNGSNSGIGDGYTGGVGPGHGPGVGPGHDGGIGDGPYRVGLGGVSAPRAIYDPEPEYSDEARQSKYQGVVVLRIVVGSDGRPQNIRVAQSLGMGLDQKAIEAVNKWRFEPGYKDGHPVPVLVDIQVNFRLY